jgi:HPt (histidine-containing phosphotransfer) domain-containing protein
LFERLAELYQKKKALLLVDKFPMADLIAATIEDDSFMALNSEAVASLQSDLVKDTDLTKHTRLTENTEVDYISEKVLYQLVEDTSLAAVNRMMAVFVSETNKRIQSMLELIAKEDWIELGKEAHSLKSSAASYGALSLSTLAEKIESDVYTLEHDQMLAQLDEYAMLSKLGDESLQQLTLLLEAQNA